MSWVSRWIRTTFDYNPTFPLSALALMAGLRMLAGDGAASADVSGSLAGVGVITGYELCLLGAALLFLWPRRIAYETTAILIIFGVVRFATPFLAIGLAADTSDELAALGLGVCLTLLMVAKGEAITRRVGLRLRVGERAYDYGLFALAAIGFPLLSERMAAWTGSTITHETARSIQLAAWWSLSLVLLPLTRGLGLGVSVGAPLRSRVPAIVWRCLTAGAMATLLFNSLWLAGEGPSLLSLLPMALLAAALFSSILAACERQTPRWVPLMPAAVMAIAVVAPSGELMGRLAVLSHPTAALATGAVALLWLPFIARGEDRRRALRALACVATLAPLRFSPSLPVAQVYLVGMALLVTGLGLSRRNDGAVALGGVGVAIVGGHLLGVRLGAITLAALMGWGGVLAAAVAWRIPKPEDDRASAAGRVAAMLCLVPCAISVTFFVGAGAVGLFCGLGSSLGLAILGRRHGRTPLLGGAGAQAVALVGRRTAGSIDPGVALVLLAFAAIPVGTAIAIRRERRREVELPTPAAPTPTGGLS